MANTWFECKIRYEKVMENGKTKKVTEPYLVDALSFTEAEARIIEEITPFVSGEFTVSDIKRANYSELFPSEEESADRWFKCKLAFITLDEKTGAEKRTNTNVLVQAADLRQAVKNLDEGMKGSMVDYAIVTMAETAIMDVYQYTANDKSDDSASTPVGPLIASCPDGEKIEVKIADKTVIIDKTGKNTVVIPQEKEVNNDIRGNAACQPGGESKEAS